MEIYLKLIGLGVIQGATEFLPVSSSGHLALVGKFFDIGDSSFILAVLLHLATLAAVLVYFRRELIPVYTSRRGLLLVVAMTIPTGVIGLALKKTVESMFSSDIKFVSASLAFTAVIIFAASWRIKNFQNIATSESSKPSDGSTTLWAGVTPWRAFLIGVAQGIAVIPGISRSGSTFSSAVFLGVPPAEAAKFSFIASIPAVLGAGLLMDVKEIFVSVMQGAGVFSAGLSPMAVALAFVAAFVTGFAAIKFFLSSFMLKDGKGFRIFSYYLVVVAVVLLIFFR